MNWLSRRCLAPIAAMTLVVTACAGGSTGDEDTDAPDAAASEDEEAGDDDVGEDDEATAPSGDPSGTLRIARPDDVRALNPLRQANNATSEVTYQIHEGLVTLDVDQEVVPVLASEWQLLDDDLTYRLTLREGVSFHSGEPFNAEAVKWNMERQLFDDPPGIASGLLPEHEAVEVVDEYTVDMVLAEPAGVYMEILAAPLFMMMDPSQWEELGEEGYDDAPSGTGPFMLDDWAPDERVELVANPEYWDTDNGPLVERVVFEVMPEASSRTIALQNGEVDMIFALPAEDVDSFAGSDEHQVYTVPSMRAAHIGLNTVDPVIGDIDVRRALAHATDRDQIDTVIGENGVRVDGIGTPDAFGYFPSTLPFEPDTAEALLDDAGWTRDGDGIRQRDGQDLEVEVMTAGTAPGQNEALQVMQQQWQQVGVRMEISLIDGGALNAQLESEAGDHEEDSTNLPDYQGFMLASGIRTGEVGYILGRPQCDSGNRNHERHCNPEYDEAFALSQSTASPEERLEGFEVMARIFEEEVLRLPIYVINLNVAASTSVQGFELNPNEALDLRGVSIDS